MFYSPRILIGQSNLLTVPIILGSIIRANLYKECSNNYGFIFKGRTQDIPVFFELTPKSISVELRNAGVQPFHYQINIMSEIPTLENLLGGIKADSDRQILGELKRSIHQMLIASPNYPQIVEHFIRNMPRNCHLEFSISTIEDLIRETGVSHESTLQVLTRWFWNEFALGQLSQSEEKRVEISFMQILLNDEDTLNSLAASARKSEEKCIMFLSKIQNYYRSIRNRAWENYRIAGKQEAYGFLTSIIIFVVDLMHAYSTMSAQLVGLALSILTMIIEEHPQIVGSLSNVPSALANKLLKYSSQAAKVIQTLALFVKFQQQSKNKQQAKELIQKIITLLEGRIEPGSDLSDQKSKLARNAPEKLSQFIEFFEGASHFSYNALKYLIKFHPKEEKIIRRYLDLSVQMIGIPNPFIFENSIKAVSLLLGENSVGQNKDRLTSKVNWKLLSEKMVKSCFSVDYSPESAAQLKTIMNHQPVRMNQQNMLSLIQKAVENQFEFEFDEDEFNCACNCFCFLNLEDKQTIQNFIKSLLNLNQSIEDKFKKFVVVRMYDIVSTYPILLVDNEFMTEVVEDLLIRDYPESQNALQRLIKENQISERAAKGLEKRIRQNKLVYNNTKEAVEAWKIILSIEKNQKDVRDDDSTLLIRNLAGKQLYPGKWEIPKAKIEQKKDKMKDFVFEFKEELQIISQLLN